MKRESPARASAMFALGGGRGVGGPAAEGGGFVGGAPYEYEKKEIKYRDRLLN